MSNVFTSSTSSNLVYRNRGFAFARDIQLQLRQKEDSVIYELRNKI